MSTTNRDFSLEETRKMLFEHLVSSRLTPGTYVPSEIIRNGIHVAIFSGKEPLIITGSFLDMSSYQKANALIRLQSFKNICNKFGYKNDNELYVNDVSGQDIDWKKKYCAIASKESGQVENGTEKGKLVALILAHDLAFTTALCIDVEISEAIGQ